MVFLLTTSLSLLTYPIDFVSDINDINLMMLLKEIPRAYMYVNLNKIKSGRKWNTMIINSQSPVYVNNKSST